MSAAAHGTVALALISIALIPPGVRATRDAGALRGEVEATDPRVRREGRRWLLAGAPLTGTVLEAQPGGGVAHLPIRDGWLEGIARIDYPDGTPRSRREYHLGNKQGIQLEYWPNGQKRFEAAMEGDAPVGLSRSWRADGTLAEEHRYLAGHEDGPQRVYTARGELEANYVVRGGRRYGYVNPMPCTEAADLAEAR